MLYDYNKQIILSIISQYIIVDCIGQVLIVLSMNWMYSKLSLSVVD